MSMFLLQNAEHENTADTDEYKHSSCVVSRRGQVMVGVGVCGQAAAYMLTRMSMWSAAGVEPGGGPATQTVNVAALAASREMPRPRRRRHRCHDRVQRCGKHPFNVCGVATSCLTCGAGAWYACSDAQCVLAAYNKSAPHDAQVRARPINWTLIVFVAAILTQRFLRI